jgi:hypothetical protein
MVDGGVVHVWCGYRRKYVMETMGNRSQHADSYMLRKSCLHALFIGKMINRFISKP